MRKNLLLIFLLLLSALLIGTFLFTSIFSLKTNSSSYVQPVLKPSLIDLEVLQNKKSQDEKRQSKEKTNIHFERNNKFTRTNDGRTVQQVMDEYDVKLASQWPKGITVDLFIRTGSRDCGLLPPLFKSIELFWPKGIGKIVVVVDPQDLELVASIIPDYAEIHFESFIPGIPARLANQMTNFWVDNYTNADYVACIDSDLVLMTKVTPDLIFYNGTNKPIVIGNPSIQRSNWYKGNIYFLGDNTYHANFMWNLPMIYSTKMLKTFRKHVMDRVKVDYFDGVIRKWYTSYKNSGWDLSQFTILGNYMYEFHRDEYHFAIEEVDEPVLRFGCHVVNTRPYKMVKGKGGEKLSSKYFLAAGKVISEGICMSIPKYEMNNTCEAFYQDYTHKDLWAYYFEPTWGKSFTKYSNYTEIMKKHYQDLHDLY